MTSPPAEDTQVKLLSVLHLDSIRNRILVLALMATLIPAVGTAVISYIQNRRAITDNLNGELVSRGSQAAREVDLWVKQRQYDVRVFTGSFEVSENLERIPLGGAGGTAAQARLTEYLTGVYSRFTDYADLVATDGEGTPVASTGGAPDAIELDPVWLVQLRRGEDILADPYWDTDRGQVSATLAVPIEAAGARFVGVLAATLAFDAIGAELSALAPGEGGRIDLITGDGELIASSSEAVATGLAPALDEATLDALRGAEGVALEFADRSGTAVLGVLTPVPALPWAVVTQVPTEEAFAQIAQLRTSAIFLVSFLTIVVGGIAYLLGLVIVRPLARLTAGAGAVAAGDLSVDLPAGGRGEVGYLTEVFNEMVSRLRRGREELDERNRELELLSTTDQLTGLHNRRYLLDAFDKEIRRADRHERPFCVLMIDVDRFKQYNDTYGHPAGDQVLRTMGTVVRDATRDLDVCARYGGEEFIILLPECELGNGVMAAERIRSRLAEETFEGGAVTISVGVAEFPAHGNSAGEVIGEADAALYEAKREGRDRVRGASVEEKVDAPAKTATRTEAAKKKRGAPKKKAGRKPAAKKPAKKPAKKKSAAAPKEKS